MAWDPARRRSGMLHLVASVTRRQFFLIAGVLGGAAALVYGGAETLRFLFPDATAEAPLRFKVQADPAAITVDNPLEIYEHRVAIVRDDRGLYAVQLICTHLGCTPNYTTNVTQGTGLRDAVADAHGARKGPERIPNGWACPCHGSRYFIDSTNFYGPAPRPMDWVDVQFGPDGSLVVDRSRLVVMRTAGDTTTPEWRLDPVTKKDNGRTYGV